LSAGAAIRDYRYFRGRTFAIRAKRVLIMSRARNVQPAAAFKNNKTYFAGSVDTAPSRKSRIRNSRPALV
jgi:hypothetical protein